MKLALVLLIAACAIIFYAFQTPALFFLGYLWTSLLYPQAFVHPYFDYIPLASIFGALTLLSYFFIDRSRKGNLPASFYITVIFAVWITATTFFALVPHLAWEKWNWSIESVLIALVMPFFLRTREQIEAGYLCALSAFAAHVLTAGTKTLLGSGAYGALGRLMMTNFWLGETSTLALTAIISIPMAYYAVRHSVILEHLRGRALDLAFVGYTIFALACVVGTSARTGVIALAVLLLLGIPGLIRKILIVSVLAGTFFAVQPLLPAQFMTRITTLTDYRADTSAMTRIAVWKWALDFAQTHPFGGGFGAFSLSKIDFMVEGQSAETEMQHRAPHSIYMEVLGEQGYIGLILYLLMLFAPVTGVVKLRRTATATAELSWTNAFGRSLSVDMLVYAAGAAFIGVAYQPLSYLFTGLYFALYRLMHEKEPAHVPASAERLYRSTDLAPEPGLVDR